MHSAADTIFALSSGPPPAAIAVIRVSGPQAGPALSALAGRLPQPRMGALATLRDPADRSALDQALVLWFPGPASETGEDVAELQIHGGRAVIAATLRVLGALPGLRLAEPGEFTRRALANGQIGLTAVEGLADLIGAETEAQRRQAVRQLRGALGKRAEGWRQQLIAVQARIEADLDFSDEGDVPAGLLDEVRAGVKALQADIQAALDDGGRGERLREGLTIAIAGPPNAGKSSLFNWLAGRDVAIVSPYPGTTRDVLEVHLDLGGYPVTVLDTAGVRESDDPVEREGIARAVARAADADLVLWVEDAASTSPVAPEAGGAPVWRLRNKMDLLAEPVRPEINESQTDISVRTGEGLAALVSRLATYAEARMGGGEGALITRERHRQNMKQCSDVLIHIIENDLPEDLVAEDLRVAATALGRLVGRIDVENVLDALFSGFCIGK
ncbi:MAG: tRNA uridine-5-carboxymethylaminomethyl(34) synthesis GTPase MnmE [Rhizobiales bacterium]|nr:tRNA uridine-5-carboxymethylaminomethyl(34) synthesis GTPase MnmE [Hyphomicrobiales bacterium]